jgi:hypothetical protein
MDAKDYRRTDQLKDAALDRGTGLPSWWTLEEVLWDFLKS